MILVYQWDSEHEMYFGFNAMPVCLDSSILWWEVPV